MKSKKGSTVKSKPTKGHVKTPAQVEATLELLYKPFPEIAAAIKARSGKILERWQTLVRENLPTADELTLTQLRDDMPMVLMRFAEALKASKPASVDALIDVSSA